ncbi:TPA: hypothetical protein ACH3X1_000736 [Trebouxia sp. C0004]
MLVYGSLHVVAPVPCLGVVRMQRLLAKRRICQAGAGIQSMFPVGSIFQDISLSGATPQVFMYISHVRCRMVICAALHQGKFKLHGAPTWPSALDRILSVYESARKAQRLATLQQLGSAGL